MKCPNCGKWNRAAQPHCVYCGQELPTAAYGMDEIPQWQLELHDEIKPSQYLRVDDTGDVEPTEDPRDKLAYDMVDLKTRKLSGEERQRWMREYAAEQGLAPSSRDVRTEDGRVSFYSGADDPSTSLRTVTPERVEGGNVRPDARRVYPRYRTTYSGSPRSADGAASQQMQRSVYDGYPDAENVLSMTNRDERDNLRRLRHITQANHKPRKRSARRILRALMIMGLLAAAGWFIVAFALPMIQSSSKAQLPKATVLPTIRDDLAAHTVAIPGTDGQRITIRELRTSAIVIGGIATFDIPDHVWYDDEDLYLEDTMTVTLSPYVISDSGRQQPLDTITYEIDIPLSYINVETPDSLYKVVSTTMYNIVFYVREGSSITINGADYSDLVDTEDGRVSYNATVQPIGENTFTIVARSQYCRDNKVTITLYREKQDIPLDLQSDIASRVTDNTASLLVTATTIPGAVVKVLSPYTDLDITNMDSNGTFSFRAVFDKIGNNVIVITVDYPNRETTRVEHVVYYVPNIDVYSRKAWDIKTQYSDLINNLDARKAKSQIYVCKGTIQSIETTKPQHAFFNVGTEEEPLLVYMENSSRTTWVEGESYRLYGDVYGMYDGKPWLIVRYTYGMNEY